MPDVEYTPHENTLRKRNHKWVKLKSYKGREAGRRGARWHKVNFTLDLTVTYNIPVISEEELSVLSLLDFSATQ